MLLLRDKYKKENRKKRMHQQLYQEIRNNQKLLKLEKIDYYIVFQFFLKSKYTNNVFSKNFDIYWQKAHIHPILIILN